MKAWRKLKKAKKLACRQLYVEFFASAKLLDEEYMTRRRAMERVFEEQLKAVKLEVASV